MEFCFCVHPNIKMSVMETTKKRKSAYLSAIGAIGIGTLAYMTPDSFYQAVIENDFIRDIKSKLEQYVTVSPEDRLYLQLDKPMYEPGDDIWFSAYIRDGVSLKPSSKSDIVYIELINPKGTVEKKLNLIARNGKAAGDFSIDKEAVGGLYKIKAYTNWMKNEGEENAFVKEIQVQDVILPNLKMKLDFEKKAFGAGDEVIAKISLQTNENKALSHYKLKCVATLNGKKLLELNDATDEEGLNYIRFQLPSDLKTNDGLLNVMIDYNGSVESISRSIPIVLNKIQFTAFPEGGDMVNGLENTIAFKALNEFNKPADVEGVVFTAKGSKVASFSSFHQGMGAFKFIPQEGESYLVKITKPAGIKETFQLPEALEKGYSMHVESSGKEALQVQVNATHTDELALVAQVRGKIYYTTVFDVQPGSNKITFSVKDFPVGVAQITLFDSKGIARAERLAFVNKDKQMNIAVTTDKEKYLPREKVKMTLSVKDENGMPMPAHLSMAVVNDQFLSFADDKSGHLLSEMLLQQDIKEKIEEPAFYFSNKEPKAEKALDYLLMTSGWRRFTWEQVIEEDYPAITFGGERAIVEGFVYNSVTGKMMEGVKVKASDGSVTETNAEGKFVFKKLDLTNNVQLSVQETGFYAQTLAVADYGKPLTFYMYKEYNYPKHTPHRRAKFAENASVAHDEEPVPAFNAGGGMVNEQKAVALPLAAFPKSKAEQKPAEGSNRKKDAVKERADEHSKVASSASGKAMLADKRFEKFAMEAEDIVPQMPVAAVKKYYRARQYYAPKYEKQESVENRTDFRNTIYWNPDIEIGFNGKKVIEFYTSDDITSFRTTVEGMSNTGGIGRTEKTFYSQLPFAMTTKIPVEVATEDLVSIPLTLKNNTDGPLGGILAVSAPEGLKAVNSLPTVQTIMPGKAKTIYLDYKVSEKTGSGDLTISFKACGLGDAFTQTIRMVPKGFPVQMSFSAQETDKEYEFDIHKMVNGSLKATLNAYPNVVTDLMKGVEGILQEPYGCFEQTSCTAYPNAMVLDYLRSTDSKDTKTLARATDLLDRGYKRLTGFEASQKGYEWFGANPAHEGLTAYGLMEFADMKKAGQNVDEQMLSRTANWLLGRKNGKGGFEREKHAYHDFGRISEEILNAYIVYALAEAGYTDLKKEFETSYKKALDTKDPYMLAMMANAAYSLKENKKGDEAMTVLISKQEKDGSFNGLTHSITYSQGQSLYIETTALSVMAMLKAGNSYQVQLTKAVEYLVGSRKGSGVFNSTQGTILALKALTEYAKASKKTNEDGTIVVYVDGKKAGEVTYKAGDKNAITLEGLEKFISGEGKHKIRVKYVGVKSPLPYSVAVNWNTSLPKSDKECLIDIQTNLLTYTASVGETVRLKANIINRKNQDVPSTMAIIGIPAGFSVQGWQLKELQDKNVFDYYEIKGNNLAIYYRGLPANAVKNIQLDLKAEMPGEYDAPASVAYLYYTNEYKTWTALNRVSIRKANS